MMKTTKLKIEKALKHFETTDFSIREVAEKSGVSYPTIKTYLSNLAIREVSYGRYEIIGTPKVAASDTKVEKQKVNEAAPKNVPVTNKSNEAQTEATSFRESLKNELLDDKEINKEIYGEIYIAAYLKGFDRGFELGVAKTKAQS